MKNNLRLYIFLGVCVAMICISAVQILLFDGAKGLAIRTSTVNIILGAGGMAALFLLGNNIIKRLSALEDIVRPFKEKKFAALSGTSGEGQDEDAYGDLRKAVRELGKFAKAFKVHAESGAKIEKHLKPEIKSTLNNNDDQNILSMKLTEIRDAAGQALIALEHVENLLFSSDESSADNNIAMDDAGTRVAEAMELNLSIARSLDESGKVSVELREKISAGEEESKNAYDIIRSTSKELDKITEMAEIIDGISETTNILSMNAAIESAHAGAAGAGFSVVAEEIRKLAESTKDNAGDIKAVLKAISRQINEALKASEKSSATFGSITSEMSVLTGVLETAAVDARKSSESGLEIKAALTKKPEALPANNAEALPAASTGRTGKLPGNSIDLAAANSSFRSALETIQSVSAAANDDACKTTGALHKCREDSEKVMEKIRDFLKETEELEEMLFSTGSSTGIRSPLDMPSAAALPSASLPAITKEKKEKETETETLTVKNKWEENSFNLRFTRDEKLVNSAKADKPDANSSAPASTSALSRPAVNSAMIDSSVYANIKELSPDSSAIKETEDADNSWRKDVNVKIPPRIVY